MYGIKGKEINVACVCGFSSSRCIYLRHVNDFYRYKWFKGFQALDLPQRRVF